MKEKPNIAVEADTEEMRKWRGLRHSEMDLFWKNLAGRMEEEVLNKYEVTEKRLSEVEVLLWNGEGCAKARNTEEESGEKIAWQESSLSP